MDYLGLNITSLSTDMAMQKTLRDVSLSVVKKEMEQSAEMGSQLIRMMERSVTPNLGSHVDVRL